MLTGRGAIAAAALPALEAVIDALEGVTLVYEPDDQSPLPRPTKFEVTLYVENDAREAARAALRGMLGEVQFEPLVERDWVTENQASFPPITIGRWRIVRDAGQARAAHEMLIIPANAFGGGEHATTQVCLHHYEKLVNEGRVFVHGLDVGCGSGILAMAAAALQGTRFVALDIDPASVTATEHNARENGVGEKIVVGLGSVPHALAESTFDVVFANILLGPLLELAEALVATVATDGVLILSGFTANQAEQIEARYGALGMRRVHHTVQDNWVGQTWRKS